MKSHLPFRPSLPQAMAEIIASSFLKLHIFFFILSMASVWVEAEVYTVGDDEKWSTGVNYGQWSQKYNFSIGDVLAFSYVKGQHNTYEVTQETYKTCDINNGVLQEYYSGNDQILLTEAKNYWFICNLTGHCFGGMKLGIQVQIANSSNQTDDTNEVPITPPANKTSGMYSQLAIAWTFYLIVVVLFLNIDWKLLV